MKKILIAGGSGFIGDNLRRYLLSKRYEVFILTTNSQKCSSKYEIYWNPEQKVIQLNNDSIFDSIVNLAGANIGEKYWTKKRKKILWDSRIDSTNFLRRLIESNKISCSYFLQASAIGYYGEGNSKVLSEESPKGNGFLADLTAAWEHKVLNLMVPYSIFRFGIVLNTTEGAFKKLILSLNFKIALVFGTGKNYISWIDSLDLVRMLETAIDLKLKGTFNAVSPKPIKNINLLRKYSLFNNLISIPLYVPKWILRLFLGDFSELFLLSQRVSSLKIERTGFVFKISTFDNFLTTRLL